MGVIGFEGVGFRACKDVWSCYCLSVRVCLPAKKHASPKQSLKGLLTFTSLKEGHMGCHVSPKP